MRQRLQKLKAFIFEVRSGRYGYSLRLRLFFFLLLFLFAIMLALLLVLFTTGVFSLGLTESRIFLENELHHIAGHLENGYGTLSVEGVALSEKLGGIIEAELQQRNIPPAGLVRHPELLEAVLDSCLDPLLFALEKNAASAAFCVLNATVNPALDSAERSRAGVFLRNMEPNAVYRSNPSIHCLRGPVAIARERGIYMLPQWELEFAVQPGDFFHTALRGAEESLSLSRLYYWSPKSVLSGDYEEAMLLSVPIVSSDGVPLGVCGFEVNAMLFKLQHAPSTFGDGRVFALLAPSENGALDLDGAMFAGSFGDEFLSGGRMAAVSQLGGLTVFESPGFRTCGLVQNIRLYPKGAIHGEDWAVAVLMPEGDLRLYAMRRNVPILVLLAMLLVLSVLAALLISSRYLAPVLHGIDQVKIRGLAEYTRTNIKEIDDLFAFLSERDAERTKPEAAPDARPRPDAEAEAMFAEFMQKFQTLSRAEKAVFNLYVQGYDAKEITQILCLSINTIKTHNKRIYYKLGVNSRKELMGYLRKMREQGFDVPVE